MIPLSLLTFGHRVGLQAVIMPVIARKICLIEQNMMSVECQSVSLFHNEYLIVDSGVGG